MVTADDELLKNLTEANRLLEQVHVAPLLLHVIRLLALGHM